MSGFGFQLLASDGAARRGRLTTAQGSIETPAFMPVGTAATVKAMTVDMLAATGAEIALCNTYHLMLRPGPERIARLGGLHRFMGWQRPILTDSGGYQVMSLAARRQLDESGVVFASHLDGSLHELTPERAVEIQHLLDATITVQLDECLRLPAADGEVARAMELSLRWALRCKAAFVRRPGYGLFGIVQGSVFPALREESTKALTSVGFDGYAVGGLAVGEGQDTMFRVLDQTVPMLPTDRPRYLMGVGRPADIVGAVKRGIDMFDCVMPTRNARNGQVFTSSGKLNIRNARYAHDERPLDDACGCMVCQRYSRAYLRHLYNCGEMLAATLCTYHNLAFYLDSMRLIRQSIALGEFAAFRTSFLNKFRSHTAGQ